jgi:hypothetical protein
MFLVDDYCVHSMNLGRLAFRLPGHSLFMFPFFSTVFSFVFSYIRDLVPPRLHSRVMHGMTEMEFFLCLHLFALLCFPFLFSC